MIKNDREYALTKSELAKINEQLDTAQETTSEAHKLFLKAEIDQLHSYKSELEKRIQEYEQLLSGEITVGPITNLGKLPLSLIQARIVKGWTQKELAEKLGLKPQQIQRWEAEEYLNCSFSKLIKVAEVLNLNVGATEEINWDIPSKVFKKVFDLGWLEDFSGTYQQAKRKKDELIASYFIQYGFSQSENAFNRSIKRAPHNNDKVNSKLWHTRILQLSERKRAQKNFDLSVIKDDDWCEQLARLSALEKGPYLAQQFLKEAGINLFVEHRIRPKVDGALFCFKDRNPIIGLTLFHNRMDNFWFTLFHEIGHLVRHSEKFLKDSEEVSFVDAFEDKTVLIDDKKIEKEADDFALDKLIPKTVWETLFSRFTTDPALVIQEAKNINRSPAIIAGRIRYESNKWSILNDLVGHGAVKPIFESNEY